MTFQYAIRRNSPVEEQRDRELEDYLASLLPTPWVDLTLLGTFSASPAGSAVAASRKQGDMVHVRFHIAPGVSGTAAFTLPEGSRPPGYFDAPCIAFNGVHDIANAFVQVSGSVILTWTAAAVTSISSAFQFSTSE